MPNVGSIIPLVVTLSKETVKGSASHAFESHVGTMCATVADPVGLAQALVHELAHTKLRCLGIWLESADFAEEGESAKELTKGIVDFYREFAVNISQGPHKAARK